MYLLVIKCGCCFSFQNNQGGGVWLGSGWQVSLKSITAGTDMRKRTITITSTVDSKCIWCEEKLFDIFTQETFPVTKFHLVCLFCALYLFFLLTGVLCLYSISQPWLHRGLYDQLPRASSRAEPVQCVWGEYLSVRVCELTCYSIQFKAPVSCYWDL